MTTFLTNSYLIIFDPLKCYTTLIVKELPYNKKIKKNVHNYNRNQHIK